ncbi:hypothetical protein GCM10017559_43300 [Streptosporangium longisporum]|uniref:Uncharacterized protein n=1 Tax=Streptosporangium longisporum TaxID=46187 RepID=A0ABP6KK89_9ACTN
MQRLRSLRRRAEDRWRDCADARRRSPTGQTGTRGEGPPAYPRNAAEDQWAPTYTPPARDWALGIAPQGPAAGPNRADKNTVHRRLPSGDDQWSGHPQGNHTRGGKGEQKEEWGTTINIQRINVKESCVSEKSTGPPDSTGQDVKDISVGAREKVLCKKE